MKRIRVAYTNQKRIIAIPNPTAIAILLKTKESIVQNWYYDQPQELESFLKIHPEKEKDVLKAFAYWVKKNVFGFEEKQNKYGTLKHELQKFSHNLFKSLRAIAGKIARDIQRFLFPSKKKQKKIIY